MPISPNTEPAHESAAVDTRPIACMEVWGGSAAFDSRVSVPGNDIRVSCTPHAGGASGGDVYYVSNCAAGLITRFVLADIAGHGEQVARFARGLRTLMRAHINTADQSRFAVALNLAFAELDTDGRFATAALATYFAPTDHLIICNAGHPRPLLYRAGAGTWSLLDVATPGTLAVRQPRDGPVGIANLPLGILDPTNYEQFALRLEPGDVVVFYTDALIEATDESGAQLGENGLLRLAATLSDTNRADIAKSLHQQVLRSTGTVALNDDTTLMVLHHNAGNPPHPTLTGRAAKLLLLLGLGSVDSEPVPSR